jgi:hypothetical protein
MHDPGTSETASRPWNRREAGPGLAMMRPCQAGSHPGQRSRVTMTERKRGMNEQQAQEMLILLRMIELNTALLASAFSIKQGDLKEYREFCVHAAGEDPVKI